MKVKDMRVVYGGLIVLFIGVIGLSLYQLYSNLGGTAPVEIVLEEPIKRTVVGKMFKTRYTDKQIEAHFVKCRELIENNDISGDLIVITYLQDSVEGNYVEQFIGISLAENMAEIPIDFEVEEYQSKKRYVAHLTMHPLVRPTPEQIENEIITKAAEDSNKLLPFVMEIHHDNNSMTLESWIE